MSELGSTAAVGIESVEWVDAGAGNLTVRVTGRWRRRRPSGGGAPVLVVEAEGRRQRFAALPEPPSLAGTAPGMWRLSFSVPGELAPVLGGHVWLALGSVTVPLPVPESGAPETDEPAAAPVAAEESSEASSAPADEVADPPAGRLEIERAWRRADDAERASARLAGQVSELEQALAAERRDREAASASLADRDRRRRAAEQRAHAEEAMRRELARRLQDGARESARTREAMGELAAAEERARELESELREARRRGDEAERSAASARAARERAEATMAARERADGGRGERGDSELGAERDRLRFESEVRARRPDVPRVPEEPPAVAVTPPGATASSPVPGPVPETYGLPEPTIVVALRRELDARVAAEAGLRARTVRAETRLATRVLLEQRTAGTLRELRSELDALREALDSERERRRAAEATAVQLRQELGGQRERSQDAYEAIGELRGALDHLRPPATAPGPAEDGEPGSAGTATPDRLSDALARLREASEPREPVAEEPGPPPAAVTALAAVTPSAPVTPAAPPALALGRPTVDAAFRRLAAREPALAGRLLLDLLGAQRAAWPHPVAYDLVLGPGQGCVQVTVGEDRAAIEMCSAPRTREQVDFRLIGDPARIARLLAAGPLRRLLRLGLARARGRRDRVGALRALLALPLDLGALRAAGMRDEPETLLALVAAMIDPAWTRGERFALAHVDERGATVFLEVRDGSAPLVTRAAPEARVAVTLSGTAGELAGALATGGPGVAAQAGHAVGGDAAALALVRGWVNRAQRG
jgi:hypothetical protein